MNEFKPEPPEMPAGVRAAQQKVKAWETHFGPQRPRRSRRSAVRFLSALLIAFVTTLGFGLVASAAIAGGAPAPTMDQRCLALLPGTGSAAPSRVTSNSIEWDYVIAGTRIACRN